VRSRCKVGLKVSLVLLNSRLLKREKRYRIYAGIILAPLMQAKLCVELASI
jgi:hypothetical protein